MKSVPTSQTALAIFGAALLMISCGPNAEPLDDEQLSAEPSVPSDGEELPPDEGEGDNALGVRFDARSVPEAGVRAGDTIFDGAIEVIVPEPGESVATTGHFDDGSWRSLLVTHLADGRVRTKLEDEATIAVGEQVPLAGSPGACKDSAFTLAAHAWTSTYRWSFRSGSTPTTNSKSNVEAALLEAVTNITRSRNNCGLADTIGAKHKYLGRTRRGTNVVGTTTATKCGTRDGHNVVGFGVLPRGVLAVACTWFTTTGAVEGDVKINDRFHTWYAQDRVPAGCRAAFSVEAIATHEFGHVYGLSHVSERAHGKLTMSTKAQPCSAAPSTLGRGDVLGLRKKYGP